jgi:hypothetical protein
LALRIGEIDVDAMLARIPLSLLYEWAEYAELEILSDAALDVHLARIASILANAHRDRRKRRRPFDVKEFTLLKDRRKPRRQTPDQMKHVLKTMSAMHNAALEQKRRGKKRS